MPGPPPKTPETRRRTNRPKSGDWVVLPSENTDEAPPLPTPPRGIRWTKVTKDWWAMIWSSPMSTQWLQADVYALGEMAALRQQMMAATRIEDRLKLSTLVDRYADKFGLSPKGRRDLRWVVTDEDAQAAGIRPSLTLVRRIPAK